MNYRKEIEQFARWYIPITILSLLVSGLLTNYFKEVLSGELTMLQKSLTTVWLLYLVKYIDNLVVTFWLLFQAKKSGFNVFVWCAFGLITNLIAVVIYLLIHILNGISFNKQSERNAAELQTFPPSP